jgi:SAM-dependent methyltransferase
MGATQFYCYCLLLFNNSLETYNMKEFWNERYASDGYAYGKEPNVFLQEHLKGVTPGTILLPCEGEGRNAVFAARLGWQVVAFDQSESGKDKCLQLAKEYNVKVDYRLADAGYFSYQENHYDCIALIYAHFPPVVREYVHKQCIKALRPGGLLFLEAFHPNQFHYKSGGPKEPDLLYTREQLLEDFQQLKQLLCEEKEIELAEGPFHQGKAFVVRLVAQKQ